MTKVAEERPLDLASAPPSAGVNSLYQFVREELAAREGTCTRTELLSAIRNSPAAWEKLERSRGFGALLSNMKHSGFIELDGEVIRRTARLVGRRHR